MGRSSADKQAAQAVALTAARGEALGLMNAALRAKLDEMEALGEGTRTSNLRYYHRLGEHVIDVRANPGNKYGAEAGRRPMKLLEAAMFVSARTLRKAAKFTEAYDPAELEELLSARNEAANFAIHWGHLSYLLTLSTSEQRINFVNRTIKNLWDPPALHAAIKRYYGDRSSGGSPHGRKHELPKTIHLQIRQIMEATRAWTTKHDQVWNGDDTNVIANILASPPDDLEQADLENLQTIEELLPQVQTYARQFRSQVTRAKEHVRTVVAARASQDQADETHETFQGREPRSIDLGDVGNTPPSTEARRRRRQTAQGAA